MTEEYDPLASVQAAGPPGTVSFNYGLPDPETFPVDDLRRAVDQVLQERWGLALQYGPEQGYGPLIDYLRHKIERDEGLALDRSRIMLTGGSAQTLDHLCLLFSRPGDVVLVEAPTYFETLRLFHDHGLRSVQIPIDEGGLQLDALAARLEALTRTGQRPRFLYVIPSFQNPSGITLAADRRQPLLDLIRDYDLWVLEDDVYRDLAWDGSPPPSLFALDGGEQVLRIGSFSKILAPGLRLGWLLASPNNIERVVNSGLRLMGGGANPFIANVVGTYCQLGLLEPHIERLNQVYQRRRDVMLSALENHMPEGTHWTHPGGGCFVWLTLPEPLQAAEVVKRAKREGVMVLAGDPFFAEMPTGQHLRLAYSYVPAVQIAEGIEKLAQAL